MRDLRNIRKGLDRMCYFASCFGLYYMPGFVSRMFYGKSLAGLSDREREEVERRVSYYVNLPENSGINSSQAIEVRAFSYPYGQKKKHTTYFFDLYPYMRQMPQHLRFHYLAGDVDFETEAPTFVKARPVTNGLATNSVLCRLNSIRHFRFVKDHLAFRDKDNIVVSRNVVQQQPWRSRLLELYCGHPATDFGQINSNEGRAEWVKPFLSIEQQLTHKFIMCIRGHDVATNLKWVMSSNSIAVMPRPTVESWFMEGLLKPDYHYIEIKDDYSDLIEKIEWFISHPKDAEEINHNAHLWVERFRDKRLERIIMSEVVRRYFEQTGQI